MAALKLLLAAALLLLSTGIGLFFGLGGLGCALAFTLFAGIATVHLRRKHGGGRDAVYFAAFGAAQVLEVVLIGVLIDKSWLGMHRIMDGYSAPFFTEILIALVPVGVYVACVNRWAATSR